MFTHDADLVTLVHKLNSIVNLNAAGEKFITFFVARYDSATRMLEYVNAAHNPPVIYNTETGEVTHLKAGCVGIGMLDEIPGVKMLQHQIKGYSKIVCYTDGLSELQDDTGHDIGTTAIIRHISNKTPVRQNIVDLLDELGVPEKNPGIFDDVSIIVADLL
jgi:sigma-B regulation protein RsbU (phosphoserine phosphatase)